MFGDCPSCLEERKAYEDRIKRFNASSGVPKRFLNSRFSTFVTDSEEQAEAMSACKEYALNFKEHLEAGTNGLLIGRCGTGKTHLASAIAAAIVHKNLGDVKFMTMVQAIRSIKQTYSRNCNMTEAQAIQNLVEPDLLIIDEVGVQFDTDAEKVIVSEVINERYNNLKPTILISNLELQDLTKVMGIRVVDRIVEGDSLFLQLSGNSYRRK